MKASRSLIFLLLVCTLLVIPPPALVILAGPPMTQRDVSSFAQPALDLQWQSATSAQETAAAQAATDDGTLFAIDFQPDLNGFQFANYGASHPEGDLTITELRALFGDSVCAQIRGDTCVPTPEAEVWMAKKNKTMAAGHCIGFTVLSHRIFAGEIEATQFVEATNATSFDILQDVAIMRHIAQSYAMYYIPGLYKENAVTGSPAEIVEAMLASKAPVDLGIFANDGAGHSMLAYGVRETTAGQYEILVYDNNHPGEMKTVLVDPRANTWSYQEGAVSPGDTTKRTWAGDARTATLEFIPLSAYSESERRCPSKLCPDTTASEGAAADRGALSVAYQGEADLVVTNAQGQNAGRVFGQFVNAIPETSLIRVRGTRLGDYPPEIELPNTEDISVRVLTDYDQVGDLQVFAPDFVVSVDGLTINRNRVEEIGYVAASQQTRYRANNAQQPTFKLAGDNYLVVLGNLDMGSDSELDLTVDPDTQNPTIATQGLQDKSATLLLVQLADEQINLFASNAITLPTGGSVTLDIAGWNGTTPLTTLVDAEGDGSPTPLALANQSIGDAIQEAQSGQEIVTLVGELPAYLDQGQTTAFLDQLATFDLSGYDLGMALFEFKPTDEQLVDFVNQAGLLEDPQELAQLLYAQHKAAAQLEPLIAQLNLPAATQTTLAAALDKMTQVQDAAIAWDSYNPDDKIAALPQFLHDQAFDIDQLVVFLKGLTNLPLLNKGEVVSELALSLEEQAQVLAALGWMPPEAEMCVPAVLETPTATLTATEPLTTTTSTPTTPPPATPIATPTKTLPSTAGTVNRDANLRSGPGTTYPTAGNARKGALVTVVGISADGGWYKLETGVWIAIFLVDGFTGSVPTVTAPPQPTPTLIITATAVPAPVVEATTTSTPLMESTAMPTATSAAEVTSSLPIIEFQANPLQIKQCECAQISWRAEGVQAVYYQGQGQAGVTSRQECPMATTTYTLQVFKTDGSEEVKQVTVEVAPDATCTPPTPTPQPQSGGDDNENENENENDNNENSNDNAYDDSYDNTNDNYYDDYYDNTNDNAYDDAYDNTNDNSDE